jgi:CRISPR/Cas system-associated endonuclease Cas1
MEDDWTERRRVQLAKEWIARRTARLDQRKKQYEDQYPLAHPDTNLQRLNDLEATEFMIDIHRWELEEHIKELDESDDED